MALQTRIARLKEYHNIIGGRDLDNILKDGHVYSVKEVAGEIILRDLGEHAQMEDYGAIHWQRVISDGIYLLTKEEAKNLNARPR